MFSSHVYFVIQLLTCQYVNSLLYKVLFNFPILRNKCNTEWYIPINFKAPGHRIKFRLTFRQRRLTSKMKEWKIHWKTKWKSQSRGCIISRSNGRNISLSLAGARLRAIPEGRAFHEDPDSGNDCAEQERRYPDNGHGTWSKTVLSVLRARTDAQKDIEKDFENRYSRNCNCKCPNTMYSSYVRAKLHIFKWHSSTQRL